MISAKIPHSLDLVMTILMSTLGDEITNLLNQVRLRLSLRVFGAFPVIFYIKFDSINP